MRSEELSLKLAQDQYNGILSKIVEVDATLSSREIEIATKEAQLAELVSRTKQVQDEFTETFKKNQKMNSQVTSTVTDAEATKQSALASVSAALATLETERAQMAIDRVAIAQEREEAYGILQITSTLSAEINSKKDELKAREIEATTMSNARKGEIKAIEDNIAQQETEKLHLEAMRDEATKATDESRLVLEEINKARAGSEILMNDINAAREKAEDRRIAAQSEISSASYALDMAKNMMLVFRQALNTYIQLNGQAIQIPEITDEHRIFIVKDMLSQMTTPWDLPSIGITIERSQEEAEVQEEMAELADLRKRYEEKFQKKGFNGWGIAEFRSKLQ